MTLNYIRGNDPSQRDDPPTGDDIPDSAFEDDQDEDDSFWKQDDGDESEGFSDEDAAAPMR